MERHASVIIKKYTPKEIKKMYIYVNVMERDISTPQTYTDLNAAKHAMRKDFIKAIGEDTVNEYKSEHAIDLTDINVTLDVDSDFGITDTSAWANDAFGGNHTNWDGKIFEI